MKTYRTRSCQVGRSRLWIAVGILALPLTLQTAQAVALPSIEQVEPVLLDEDWPALVELLKDVTPETPSPVLRLIKGHACLATNQNNESLAMLSGLRTEGLQACASWSEGFSESSMENPVAQYLRGDILARQGCLDKAVWCFTEGLKRMPESPLILNARGVAFACSGSFDRAREDLALASSQFPAMADVYASRGTFILQRRTDPVVALKYFEQSIEISPDYVLALNGRACARLLLHQWDSSAEDFRRVADRLSTEANIMGPMLAANLAVLQEERGKAVEMLLAELTGMDPGTSINEQVAMFRSLSPAQQQIVVDMKANQAAFNGELLSNSFFPSNATVGIEGGLKAGVTGVTPYVAGKVGAEFGLRDTTKWNMQGQQQFLEAVSLSHPNLKPREMGNIEAWTLGHMSDYSVFNQPGGVSSKEFGTEPIDEGQWRILSLYGLLYRVTTNAQD